MGDTPVFWLLALLVVVEVLEGIRHPVPLGDRSERRKGIAILTWGITVGLLGWAVARHMI